MVAPTNKGKNDARGMDHGQVYIRVATYEQFFRGVVRILVCVCNPRAGHGLAGSAITGLTPGN